MRRLPRPVRSLTSASLVCTVLTMLSAGHIAVVAAPAARQSVERDERRGPPDPCEQALRPQGNANGLHKRCEGNGGGGGVARGDFNADGFADLAVGVPFEDEDGINGVGGVNIIYGSANGLSATATADLFLDQADFGFPYVADDHFGWALAAGDFNGDTFSDLAIGMPNGNIGRIQDTGRVFLIDGSAAGLERSTARQLVLLPSGREAEANAGEALVWADFNADGYGDLAVGIPGALVFWEAITDLCVNHFTRSGEVEVFYGGPDGLTATGAQRFFRRYSFGCGSNGGIGTGDFDLSGDDRFGSSLAAGNFNGDTVAGRLVFDLVIGTPRAKASGGDFPDNAGDVDIVPGSRDGLNGSLAQKLSQNTPGVGGGAEAGDQFGRALAVGDFNADLRDDLAIGVPFEDLLDNTAADAGAVHVLFGSFDANELVTTFDSRFVSQTNLAGSSAEAGDRFGWALATGKFNNDFMADLVIGSPGEDIGTIVDAGIVQVLYGTLTGPSLTSTQLWQQGSNGLPDAAEAGDQFGYALSAWNYGRSFHSDLAIGAPFENLISGSSEVVDAGAVVVIYGSFTTLSATTINPADFWHQNVSGIEDVSGAGDRFGHALY